jgi:hypothetical protein
VPVAISIPDIEMIAHFVCRRWRLLTASSLVASIVVKLGFEFSVCSSTSAHASSEGRSDHPPRTLRSSYTDTVPEIEIIANFVCM